MKDDSSCCSSFSALISSNWGMWKEDLFNVNLFGLEKQGNIYVKIVDLDVDFCTLVDWFCGLHSS